MKFILYILSGVLFGLGLSLSGMIDPLKVKNFLSVGFSDWSPALIYVLFSAVLVYFLAYLYLCRKEITLCKTKFEKPLSKPIDRKLIFGATLFGIGWGIAGICPGPALVHISFLNLNFAIFIATMFLGFELQRKFM